MTKHLTHGQREQNVLTDLEASFPNFAGQPLSWTKTPDGEDPPDFRSDGRTGPVGLELTEWLDGDQMGPAKGRESQRNRVTKTLRHKWESEYKPQNFCGAFPILRGIQRITKPDEVSMRREFFRCSEHVDRIWLTHPQRTPNNAIYYTDFSNYPVMGKYLQAIRYIGGCPHGSCWIHESGDGGAYDPAATIRTLEAVLAKKLRQYSMPNTQTKLAAQGLNELYLLVHGGFNAFAYNTPSGPLSLADIAKCAAVSYETHPQRHIFDCVWFFDSLDSADDINRLIGLPSHCGRVRWLVRLWPDFCIYQGSLSAQRNHRPG